VQSYSKFYTVEGDGFQYDALCQEGYTVTFCYWNQPDPKKCLDKDFSLLHARVIYMFDSLKENYHRCGMDNLYISAKFIALAFKHEKKAVVTGVCQQGGSRISRSCVARGGEGTSRAD
jgi:hypothetical protein